MGTMLHGGEPNAGSTELVSHMLREPQVVSLRVEAARNPGLVGHDHQQIVRGLQCAQRIDCAIHEYKVFNPVHIGASVVDDAITVHERSLSQPALPGSWRGIGHEFVQTRFNACSTKLHNVCPMKICAS